MNYLLDTCALLWLANGDARLSSRARQAIADLQSTIYLSVLIAAELAIKTGNGRIQFPQPVETWIRETDRLRHIPLLPLDLGPVFS